ncbi:hypothetical protein AHF37_09804, partial [Paragonimus kellicotti]
VLHQWDIRKPEAPHLVNISLPGSPDYTWDAANKDVTDECEFVFQVALHRKIKSSTLPEFIDIRVVIIDRNDHVPTFHPQQFVNLSVPESAPVGTRVRLPLAVDPDSFEYAIKRYQLLPDDVTEWSLYQQAADRVFRGNLYHEITDLFLELRNTLDRERRANFIFEVKAYDTLNEPITGNYDERNVLKVYLTIDDINDNGPIFRPQSHKNSSSSTEYLADSLHLTELVTYKAEITETLWPKSAIIKLEAFDPDLPAYAAIRYEFPLYIDSTIRKIFKLNEHSGELFLRQPLDYEKKSSYSFDILAVDSEHDRRMKLEGTGAISTSGISQSDLYTATARVVIQVLDINDEIPLIELDYLRLDESTGRPATFATVEENSEPPQFLADIFVTDKDVNPANNHLLSSEVQLGMLEPQSSNNIVNDQDNQLAEMHSRLDSMMNVGKVSEKKRSLKKPLIPSFTGDAVLILSLGLILLLLLATLCLVGLCAPLEFNCCQTTDSQSCIKTLYSLEVDSVDQTYLGHFHIDPTNCDVVTRKVIDREATEIPLQKIRLTVRAEDHGNPSKKTLLNLNVIILDENDNAPLLQHTYYRFTVKENMPAGTSIGRLLWLEKPNVTSTNDVEKRSLRQPVTYHINTTMPLDREVRENYEFKILVMDTPENLNIYRSKAPVVHTTTATVSVLVEDVNDNDPVIIFPQQANKTFYCQMQRENSEPPQFLADIFVTDKDVNPANNHVTCSLEPQQTSYNQIWQTKFENETASTQENMYFQLSEVRRHAGQVQYNLLTLKPLDRETMSPSSSVQRIHVNCFDSGVPRKANQAVVLINLLDVNDNEPVIQVLQTVSKTNITKQSSKENAFVYLYENSPLGTLVARLNVTDMDTGQNGRVTCSLRQQKVDSVDQTYLGHFHIDPTNCDVVTRKVIDREATEIPLQKIRLTVRAEDHGNPSKKTLLNLNVIILDENDNAPLLQHTYYRFTVKENMPAGTSIGRLVIMDLDEMYDKLTVRFYKHDNLPFQLWLEKPNVTSTNDVEKRSLRQPVTYHINTTMPLDREVRENYEFKILVMDTPENLNIYRSKAPVVHTTTATVSVLVEDVNDNDPVIIFPQQANKTFYLSNAEGKHYQLMTVNANDKDSSNVHFHFTLVSETSTSTALANQVTINSNEGFTNIAGSRDPCFLEIDRNQGTII